MTDDAQRPEGSPPPDIEQGRTKAELPASAEYFLEGSFELKKEMMRVSTEYGQFCLKLLSVAHGGAIAALLGFFGNWATTAKTVDRVIVAGFKPAFVAFSVGFVLAMFSSFFAYLNWLWHSHNRLYPEEALQWLRHGRIDNKVYVTRGLDWTNWLSIGLGITSGLLFLAGALAVVWAV